MNTFTAVIEKCPDTNLYIGYVPGFPGAHSQGATIEELNENLKEVIEMLLEDGTPRLESEFVGTQTVVVPSGKRHFTGITETNCERYRHYD
mgnify:CR=1 FL=1